MTPVIGISSSSLPEASATELLSSATAMGAECVDLRAGRGQGWEPEFDLIAGRLPVAFVGVGATLGAGVPAEPAPPDLMRAAIERGIPLRLFAGPLDDAAGVRRFAADVGLLRDTWGPRLRLAVEPHTAAPTLAQLDDVLAEHGIGAVVDTLGLVRLGASLDESRAFLCRHAIAVQVKGLVLRDGVYRHTALSGAPSLTAWTAALISDARVPITVETKAGTAAEDIRTLRQALQGSLSAPVPQEVVSCVLAS
ncbi:hypothetical protein [Streptomyces dysideae]|uniref:Uncharacterized protein n=1 Tax=Streptomyces dysideae TaxID=909626 RepID=A0A117S0Y5_9ACTN|nr:hypothetical protein [Streptomyces dysideae]KUO20707.1 hypothetical protein AQJ91_12325 [Streptomyces dysideae]